MDVCENRLDINDEQKLEEFFRCVIKAVKKTREVATKVAYRCRKIDDALYRKIRGKCGAYFKSI